MTYCVHIRQIITDRPKVLLCVWYLSFSDTALKKGKIKRCTRDILLNCTIDFQSCSCIGNYEQDSSVCLNWNDRCLLAANKPFTEACFKLELNPCSFYLWGDRRGGKSDGRWWQCGLEVLNRQRSKPDKKGGRAGERLCLYFSVLRVSCSLKQFIYLWKMCQPFNGCGISPAMEQHLFQGQGCL